MERFGRDIILLEKLASGGMAEVYRGKHLGFGGFEKTVAIKRILPNFASNDEFKEMFRQEANLSAQLQNPNIVQIYSNGEFKGYLYLVMEFVNGKNVRQLISKAEKMKLKIPIEIACHIVAEAAKGLDYAHNFHDEKTGEELHIIHRDMSPQNIMVAYDGSIKLVDFGIAKAAARAESTKAGVLKGKFGYMSPEQAQGMKLDRRTDIFSLGIILWELLTQKRLFSTDDDLQTLNLVRECQIPKPSKRNPMVSYGLDKIVMKALSKEKSERYNSAGEFYSDIIRYLSEKHSDFIPTSFSKFVKELFADVILQEKKKRDQINLQAPPILAEPKNNIEVPRIEAESDGLKDSTKIENQEATQLSRSGASKVSLIKGEQMPSLLNMNSSHQDKAELSDEESVTRDSNVDAIQRIEISQTGTHKMVTSSLTKIPNKTNYSKVVSVKTVKKTQGSRIKIYAVAAIILLLVIGTNNRNAQKSTDNKITKHSPGVENKSNDSSQPEPIEVDTNVDTDRSPSTESNEVTTPNREPSITEKVVSIKSIEPVKEPSRATQYQEPAVSRSPNSIPGYLELRSTPVANEIYIDGLRVFDNSGQAQQTPVRNLRVKPGQRHIKLVNKAFEACWEGTVDVRSDNLVKKDVVLVNKLPR